MSAQFSTGQQVRVRQDIARWRHGVIVATLRNGAYLVDLFPQARPSRPDAADPTAADDDLAEVRRYPAEAIRLLRSA